MPRYGKTREKPLSPKETWEVQRRLADARLFVSIDHPFFGYLLAGLEFKAKTILGLTMATDGYVVLYSPEFVKTLADEELIFVLCHEVLHCALEHISRRNERQAM
ncbi:MAG: hypothetical protein ACFFD4_16235, partial [Candidatus Odinarchaeota archaeon]